jgi:hypothetical protein
MVFRIIGTPAAPKLTSRSKEVIVGDKVTDMVCGAGYADGVAIAEDCRNITIRDRVIGIAGLTASGRRRIQYPLKTSSATAD